MCTMLPRKVFSLSVLRKKSFHIFECLTETVSGGHQDFNSYPSQPPQIAAQQQPEAYQNQYPPYGTST